MQSETKQDHNFGQLLLCWTVTWDKIILVTTCHRYHDMFTTVVSQMQVLPLGKRGYFVCCEPCYLVKTDFLKNKTDLKTAENI